MSRIFDSSIGTVRDMTPSEQFFTDSLECTRVPSDAKAQTIEEIETATTIAGLRTAMLKFINAS